MNTIANCQHEAFLRYVAKEKGVAGIYGILGTRIHDTLEEIINGISSSDLLLTALHDELNNLEILNLDFPKDFRGKTSIRDNWIADMTHFCKNFTPPRGEYITEELVIWQIDENHYLQGYIDAIKINKDNSLSLIDWKTSTNFSKEDLLHHGRQLVTYALAKMQQGFTVRSVMWVMLKYCEVTYTGKVRKNSKSESEIKKVCNRGKLISDLHSVIESKLSAHGLDDIEIEFLIEKAKKENSFECLPQEIQAQFQIKPYIRTYELNDQLIKETHEYINDMIELFESKGEEEAEWPPRDFFNKDGKEDTFYCNVLCSYRNSCKHIKKHNDLRMLLSKNDDELF